MIMKPRKVLPEHLIVSPDFWYLVGLIASDGCLYTDKRHIDITAKEKAFLLSIKERLGLRAGVTKKSSGLAGKYSYRVQIADVALYDFLLGIGLTPAKSKTLKAVNVPDNFFNDFLRGVIDGDGNIRKWAHPTNDGEQWCLRVYSGSINFLTWLSGKIEKLLRAKGKIYAEKKGPLKDKIVYTLKYGKVAAKEILKNCYQTESISLPRKYKLAIECVSSVSGWSKSKTVIS